MEMTGHSYSSGEWLVRPGSEEEFIEAWTSFIEWSLDNALWDEFDTHRYTLAASPGRKT
jgi:hypothetical protein